MQDKLLNYSKTASSKYFNLCWFKDLNQVWDLKNKVVKEVIYREWDSYPITPGLVATCNPGFCWLVKISSNITHPFKYLENGLV